MSELIDYFVRVRFEIWSQTLEHLLLTLISMSLATVVGVGLGIFISKRRMAAKPVLGFVGILQTIPSLALLGFLLPLFGIGKVPAIIALFLYGLLPIVRNTYTGVTEVDAAAKEAALGMGMTQLQILRLVELPLALPVILAGIKVSTVINVGVATLCAFIGAGGLGTFIFRGISLNNTPMILAGAIPASILAVVLDQLLDWSQKKRSRKRLKIFMGITLLFVMTALLWPESSDARLTAGFNSEFIEREDGFIGLDSIYDLPLDIREMEIGLMYESLRNGNVDVIDGFSTDGRIAAYQLKLLDDDKAYFPPYQAAALIRSDAIEAHPELNAVFARFAGLISTEEMSKMNYQVDQNKEDIGKVAYEFLKQKNIPAFRESGNHEEPDLIIGSKAFTENYILATLFSQAIEGQTSLKTDLKLGFGGTKLIFDALQYNDIQLYPEYTGTGLLVILQAAYDPDKMSSAQGVFDHVADQFQSEYGITWTPPIGFNNTFALMMRKEMADSLNINSISDLSSFLNAPDK